MNREQVYLMLIIERLRSGSKLGAGLCQSCWSDAGVILEQAEAAREAEAAAAKEAQAMADVASKRAATKRVES